MNRALVINYYADRELLGLVSDEDYEAFKDLLLEELHKEWPKAAVTVDDGEQASIEVDLATDAKAEDTLDDQSRLDVETRVQEIANEVIDNREWATEQQESYDEDYDEEFSERDYDEERDDR
jgi:spore coat protein CotH